MTTRNTLPLDEAWQAYCKLKFEGYTCWDEGRRLRGVAGRTLRAEGGKLIDEAGKLWMDAVKQAYGDIAIKWFRDDNDWECHLGNGDVYMPKEKKE